MTLYNSPSFNFHIHASRLRFERIHTYSDGCPFNTDSFNVGGKDIYIADSHVHSGDDCIPIGKNTSNVLVERVTCACGNGATAVIWETDNPATYIRNVTFRNMTFINTSFAANIKSLPSYSGTIEQVLFEDIILLNVRKAINIDLDGQSFGIDGKNGNDPKQQLGVPSTNEANRDNFKQFRVIRVRNITFRNFSGSAETAGQFKCEVDDAEDSQDTQCLDIKMENVKISGAHTGYRCEGDVEGISINCFPKPCFRRTHW